MAKWSPEAGVGSHGECLMGAPFPLGDENVLELERNDDCPFLHVLNATEL